MSRKGRGVWVGSFPLGQAEATDIERELRDYLACVSMVFGRSEVRATTERVHLLVEIRKHVPGRGFGTDSAVIGNVEHVVSEMIRRAQPHPQPARRSVYEWLRAPAI